MQLNELVIEGCSFSIRQLINLLYFTPNLHTNNKIKKLILYWKCSLSYIRLTIDLFPRLKYLKIEMNREDIEQIIRFLLSKNHKKIRSLCYLCVSNVSKLCLKQTKLLIKSEKLLKNYSIKYINYDLWFW
ncbi:unnamed protein product [Rotaria sp. Silwood1]|nr:unnamed protein product [Rotaria sp. Silwood1]CAF1643555.1 unnamed protein product [Rotaria sp. Silwood1]